MKGTAGTGKEDLSREPHGLAGLRAVLGCIPGGSVELGRWWGWGGVGALLQSPGLKAYEDFEETRQFAAFVFLMSKAGYTFGKTFSIDLF